MQLAIYDRAKKIQCVRAEGRYRRINQTIYFHIGKLRASDIESGVADVIPDTIIISTPRAYNRTYCKYPLVTNESIQEYPKKRNAHTL